MFSVRNVEAQDSPSPELSGAKQASLSPDELWLNWILQDVIDGELTAGGALELTIDSAP